MLAPLMRDHAPPIGDYAVIGDCRSAALISRDGSLDWLCWPTFDSPSVFGAVLDRERGGRFRIGPAGPSQSERCYDGETNVLRTTFRTPTGTLRVTDLMPIVEEETAVGRLSPEFQVLRLVECLGGEVELEVRFDPRPGYGLEQVRLRDRAILGLRLDAGKGALITLRTDQPLAPLPGGGMRARARLRSGEERHFSLSYSNEGPAVLSPLGRWTHEEIHHTIAAWEGWAGQTTYAGPHRAEVIRSALVLKLLAFSPSGAIVAAPTTSLPERIGGDLNWDYRYCWLRDASLTARALFGLGFHAEARSFISWLLHATRLTRPELRVLYDPFGRLTRDERELHHFSGYRDSRPVRIGNSARDQLQLDVYGEVIDAATQFCRRGGRLDSDTARALISLGNYVCQHWREPDEGIWEPRSGRRHHTHSRVLCWAALDRLLELHHGGVLPRAPIERYRVQREAIRREIEEQAWNRRLVSYVRRPGGEELDATLLLLPLYGYLKPDSWRMRQTYQRVQERLGAGRGLLYRYRGDENPGEGAFGICSFWGAQYLADGGGSLQEAHEIFDQVLEFANDVGLYGEEIDPGTGGALGNFPQGFTHVGVINAALAIQARTARERLLPEEAVLAPERIGAEGAHL